MRDVPVRVRGTRKTSVEKVSQVFPHEGDSAVVCVRAFVCARASARVILQEAEPRHVTQTKRCSLTVEQAILNSASAEMPERRWHRTCANRQNKPTNSDCPRRTWQAVVWSEWNARGVATKCAGNKKDGAAKLRKAAKHTVLPTERQAASFEWSSMHRWRVRGV